MIERLGRDELQKPGSFVFVPFDSINDFFVTLHHETELLLKQQSVLVSNGKNAVIWTISELSKNCKIREKWENILGKSSGYAKAAHVNPLQRLVTFFLKSKQQIIREQLQLKPKKSSQSLREGLKVSTNKSGKCTSKTGSQAPGVPGSEEKSIPPEIVHVRQNMKCAETVRQFLMALKLAEELKSIIQFLTGRELMKILKSLGLPSFSGKSKTKQVDALFGYLTAVDAVDLKHPEKV